jgi:C-terminal peptidase prc
LLKINFIHIYIFSLFFCFDCRCYANVTFHSDDISDFNIAYQYFNAISVISIDDNQDLASSLIHQYCDMLDPLGMTIVEEEINLHANRLRSLTSNVTIYTHDHMNIFFSLFEIHRLRVNYIYKLFKKSDIHILHDINEILTFVRQKDVAKLKQVTNDILTKPVSSLVYDFVTNEYAFHNVFSNKTELEQSRYFMLGLLNVLVNSQDKMSLLYPSQNNQSWFYHYLNQPRLSIVKEGHSMLIDYIYRETPTIDGTLKEGDRVVGCNGVRSDRVFEDVYRNLSQSQPKDIILLSFEGEDNQTYQRSFFCEQIELFLNPYEINLFQHQDIEVGYINILYFAENLNHTGTMGVDDLLRYLEYIRESEKAGLIIDLRNCSGGFLHTALDFCSLVLKSGVVGYTLRNDDTYIIYRDMDGESSYDGDIIIIVSPFTSSAGECLAQTLKDYGRALIIGTTNTYGKAVIQDQYVFEGSFFRNLIISDGYFYSPSGFSHNGVGVFPDVNILGDEQVLFSKSVLLPRKARYDLRLDMLSDIVNKEDPFWSNIYLANLHKESYRYSLLSGWLKQRSDERMKNIVTLSAYLNKNDVVLAEALEILNDLLLDKI